MMKKILPLMLTMMLLFASGAAAESLTLDGKVTAAYTQEVYAASTAIVQSVNITVGQVVSAGDAIGVLRTTKVYAEDYGTVTAVFGEAGDLAETLTERWGAALYMETDILYTVSATTEKAYGAAENTLLHVGETVYLCSRTDRTRTGTGLITAVAGNAYTVHVTDGSFLVGETAEIFRASAMTNASCLGRGTVERNAPLAITASGRIVEMAVQPGDTVRKGDLLLETLEGSGASSLILADSTGVVAQVNLIQGETIAENAVTCVIWPMAAMQIEATIPETELGNLAVGEQVELTFDWNADSGDTLLGTVERISAIADPDSTAASYVAIIRFKPDASIRYGMHVTISTIE